MGVEEGGVRQRRVCLLSPGPRLGLLPATSLAAAMPGLMLGAARRPRAAGGAGSLSVTRWLSPERTPGGQQAVRKAPPVEGKGTRAASSATDTPVTLGKSQPL